MSDDNSLRDCRARFACCAVGRPRHYGKWVEQAPPPDNRQEGRRHYALARPVSRIAITAPDRHGNPANDRYSDDDYEDDDANDG